MSGFGDPAQLERARQAVIRGLGLNFEDGRLDVLAAAIAERIGSLGGGSLDKLIRRIEAGDPEVVRSLAQHLTVGETYFFRNTSDLQAFVRVVLPASIQARAAHRKLRILSAGCSSGEEPFTLAMLIERVPELAGWDVAIKGVDVNPAALARATSGRYTAWSLRQTPPQMRDRFFEPIGRDYRLVDRVRAMVSFEQRNLANDDAAFWTRGAFDVVFCRNVMMYFAPEVTRRVVSRIAASLTPGGFLFLGHAETLRGVSSDFHLRHSHGSFFYQRRDGDEDALAEAPAPVLTALADDAQAATTDADWVDAIHQASERIAALTRRAGVRHDAEAAGPGSAGLGAVGLGVAGLGAAGLGVAGLGAAGLGVAGLGVAGLGVAGLGAAGSGNRPGSGVGATPVADARELLKQERFAAALAALGQAPVEQETDTDALLLRAVLLVSSGDAARAEEVCARVLALDELNAEAHYVKALCREHAGDPSAAANHDHYALYLDPTFAMPRLHLGLIARRAGDVDVARRELSRAVALLAAEDASRILLLGGGFGREALIDLARAELRASGATP